MGNNGVIVAIVQPKIVLVYQELMISGKKGVLNIL